ncbi:hypothetical protein [Neptuniibacter halophilus]|uniref:hypothetical protein n=1 Tax=Neptuniibacter halophilus TaxID=651666 RepID=UPI0025724965|nr:hypothetical protein [Neptuniibacter halophilus]
MGEKDDSIITDESAQHDAAGNPSSTDQQHDVVEDEINDEPAEAPADPRAARLAEIAGNVRRGRQEENQEELSGEEDESSDPNNDLGDNSDPEPLPQAAQSPVYERDGQYFVKAKVNGEEKEIPWDKALRNIQINESADQRMQSVAAREKQLTDMEMKLSERAQAQQSSLSPAPPSPGDADIRAKQKELAAQYREAMLHGEDEKADEILVEMSTLGRTPATPAVDVNQIAQSAAEQVALQNERARRRDEASKANDDFRNDFPDIVGDPNLYALAKNHARDLWNENPNLTPEQVMRQTGENIRDWKKKMTTPAPKDQRTNRKRQAAGKIAAGNNQSASLGQDPAPPKTRSQTIADMRSQRPGAAG